MRSFLLFRGSRPGLFYDLSGGDSCPLRIPSRTRGLRPPTSHSSKDLMPLPDTVNYLMLSVVDDAQIEVKVLSDQVAGVKSGEGSMFPFQHLPQRSCNPLDKLRHRFPAVSPC
jgi:hypothetical protein